MINIMKLLVKCLSRMTRGQGGRRWSPVPPPPASRPAPPLLLLLGVQDCSLLQWWGEGKCGPGPNAEDQAQG